MRGNRQVAQIHRRVGPQMHLNVLTQCDGIPMPSQPIEVRESLIFKKLKNHTCNPSAVCGSFWRSNSKNLNWGVMRSLASTRNDESRR